MIQFGDVTPGIRTKLREAGNALNDTRRFLGQIKTIKGAATAYGNRLMYVLHAVDHVDQLIIACWEFNKLTTMRKDTGLNNLACMLADNMEPVLVRLEGLKKKESIQEMERTSQYMKGLNSRKEDILKQTASNQSDTAMRQIKAIRWLGKSYRIFGRSTISGITEEDEACGRAEPMKSLHERDGQELCALSIKTFRISALYFPVR